MDQAIKPMLDHLCLPVKNLEASKTFYMAALAPIGFRLLGDSSTHAAFGIGHMPYLSIRLCEREPASVHVAFIADTRRQIDEFHAAALRAGGADNGAPGLRPDYHDSYYGAFIRDPDGHNIELVKHAPE